MRSLEEVIETCEIRLANLDMTWRAEIGKKHTCTITKNCSGTAK